MVMIVAPGWIWKGAVSFVDVAAGEGVEMEVRNMCTRVAVLKEPPGETAPREAGRRPLIGAPSLK